jgi:hypothetical protein
MKGNAMNTIDAITKGEFACTIYQDEDAESPREWDNLGTMICFHGRYNLGDKHELSLEEARELENSDDVISLPLYLYDHSGLRIKVGSFAGLLPQGHAEFDSGKVGFVYCTKEKACKEYGCKRIGPRRRMAVEKVLEGEVKTYDDYLSGQVYGYSIEDKNGDHVDSCTGFYGLDDARSAANAAMDNPG